jgi:hypothetical protein
VRKECMEWPSSWASVLRLETSSVKLIMMKGKVPGAPSEKAPSRLPLLGSTSTQRSFRQPARTVSTYSAPRGLNPAQIVSTACS